MAYGGNYSSEAVQCPLSTQPSLCINSKRKIRNRDKITWSRDGFFPSLG